jgi:signal transduction histidine kinase
MVATRRELEAARRTAVFDVDATLVKIAAGVAHEMNNPLAMISGRVQIPFGTSGDGFVDAGMEEIVRQTKVLS